MKSFSAAPSQEHEDETVRLVKLANDTGCAFVLLDDPPSPPVAPRPIPIDFEDLPA